MINLKQKKFSVGILGAGPTGIVLSHLLNHFQIDHFILDKKVEPNNHPQAHFINLRTNELLRAHFPVAQRIVLKSMPPHNFWRDFVYCHSVTDNHLSRVDNFTEIDDKFWATSPTNAVHLAQNKLETALRKEWRSHHIQESAHSKCDVYLGYDAIYFSASHRDCQLTARKVGEENGEQQLTLNCKYLIAADGAHSFIRRTLGIALDGQANMQSLVNVHFTCPGLHTLLQPRPAMLYFVYNEAMVGVFVMHDSREDEWVCQIPFFPPFQSPQDFTKERVLELLRAGLGCDLPIKVKSVNSWAMHAQVAASYSNPLGNVFLIGDAAHRFPPAGGFGMNTGVQDAHNLAWKLSWVLNGAADASLLDSYGAERKPVAEANTAWSLVNYQKTVDVAATLGVDPALAKTVLDSVAKLPLPPSVKKQMVSAALKTGLYSLRWLRGWQSNFTGKLRVLKLRAMVDAKSTLPLIFPEEDIGFVYRAPEGAAQKSSAPWREDRIVVGGRAPHCWLTVSDSDIRYRLSTIELPALVQRLLATQYARAVPPLLLLVDSLSEAHVLRALTLSNLIPSTICVVSVGQPAVRSPLSHSDLQQMWQTPHYPLDQEQQQPSFQPEVRCLSQAMLEPAGNQPNNLIHCSPEGVSVMRVTDVTGRWADAVRNVDNSLVPDTLHRVVAVRPDGHVSMIGACSPADESGSGEFLARLKSRLHICTKDQ